MEGDGARALRYRKNLSIDSKIFADVQIKHSYPLARRPLLDAVEHAYDRGLVDAVIITGEKTGGEADVEQLQQIKDTRPDIPLIVGSGVTIENLERYVDYIDAIIVGTSLHIDGKLDTDFDFVRVKKFMERIESYR
jgi:membrane complex biogenesis BtpA family protein